MARRPGCYGHRETARALRELGKSVGPPANEAARFALAPTLAAAKAGAPVLTGGLRKSLAILRDPDAPKTAPRYFVGPRRGTHGARIAHLTEFFRGSRLGWFTSAWESTKGDVFKRFAARLGPAIEKRAAKLANKVAR